ncbi:MAG: D-cysteine desulfhydrase family protein [Janthinobacterium lividum]
MTEHLASALARHPREVLVVQPTPIRRLHGVEAFFAGALADTRIFVKRDDLMEIGGGGNKLRKLEFLIGDAKSKGADTIITVGGRQSNHARLTAAVCARLGLSCELVLTRVVPRYDIEYEQGGNVLLDDILGATVHDLPASEDALAHALRRADALRSQGRICYVAPSGGSSPVGCLGYAACAREIAVQERELGVSFDRVIVPNGSSGTHAGLAAGFVVLGRPASVVRSFSVLAEEDITQATTLQKTRETLTLLGDATELGFGDVPVSGRHRGAGYGIPTDGMVEAVRLMARKEGLFLDPVYSGKAFAGLLDDIGRGADPGGRNILFVMTGGSPGLFAYRDALQSTHTNGM